jgi:hypothetical protein
MCMATGSTDQIYKQHTHLHHYFFIQKCHHRVRVWCQGTRNAPSPTLNMYMYPNIHYLYINCTFSDTVLFQVTVWHTITVCSSLPGTRTTTPIVACRVPQSTRAAGGTITVSSPAWTGSTCTARPPRILALHGTPGKVPSIPSSGRRWSSVHCRSM